MLVNGRPADLHVHHGRTDDVNHRLPTRNCLGLVCFSIDNLNSDSIEAHVKDLKDNGSLTFPFVLVGTKCDMRADDSKLKALKNNPRCEHATFKDESTKLSSVEEENKKIAVKIGAKDYWECSACDGKRNTKIVFARFRSSVESLTRDCVQS
mmetsp:Transcript_13888/g.26499  ORF Transcript_13888/g.26499 Transcript_13888/m.26499 type:complete len:152 (-) Transcript_13888:92-547(-)